MQEVQADTFNLIHTQPYLNTGLEIKNLRSTFFTSIGKFDNVFLCPFELK